jgi:hypothetical protein
MMDGIEIFAVIACIIIVALHFSPQVWWMRLAKWIEGPPPPSLDEWRRTQYDRDMTESRRRE